MLRSCSTSRRILFLVGACFVGNPLWAQSPTAIRLPAADATERRTVVAPAAFRFDSPLNNEPSATTSLGSVEAITAMIDTVQKETTLEAAVRERMVQSLNVTLEQLKQRVADADRSAGIAKALANASEESRLARALVESPPPRVVMPDRVERLSIERVRESRAEAEAKATAARGQVQAIETSIRERQTRKDSLPKLIQEARKLQDELEASSIAETEDDPVGRLKLVREAERSARLAAVKQRIDTLVQEQALIESETDLWPLRQQLAKRELAAAEERLQWWAMALRERRESQIEQAISEHRQTLAKDGIKSDASMVLSLAERWMKVVAEIERIERRHVKEQGKIDELNQTLKSTRDEIKRDMDGSGSLRAGLGLKLQLLRNKLPGKTEIANEIETTDEQIAEARSLLTHLELTLDDTNVSPINGVTFGDTSSLPRKDGQIHAGEVQLLKRFATDLDQEITKLVEMKGLYESKREIVDELRLEIDSHVMWIRNTAGYGAENAKMAWTTIRWIVHPSNLQVLGDRFIQGVTRRIDRTALMAAAIIFLAFFASRVRRQLAELGSMASSRTTNSLKPTWLALLLTIALALPVPIFIWAVGGIFESASEREAIVIAVSNALLFAAAAVLPLEFLRQILRPNGLAVAHFGMNEPGFSPLRQGLRALIDLGVPLLVLWSISQSLGRSQVDASLGRLVFAIGMTMFAVLFWQSFHPERGLLSGHLRRNQDGWLSRLRHVWFPGCVAMPLALAAVSLYGYSYGASRLVERLYWTLWITLATFLAGGLMRRWLLIQRRRLAWAVHREKMEESERMELSVLDVGTNNSMEAAEINAQTSRLIRTVLSIAALVGFWVVWSPVLPAVRFLESVKLSETKLADGTIEAFTLANVVLAVPIIVLTWVAVRNLPGLIEGVLLERLPLEKAVRYAITTLASYGIIGLGIILAANTLGLRWESIQWLVAALGVGLGFGLQEIFANFISGLILLFEQPIRIGDVVTLGDTTGVVSRIRIRATTVTNWDRQELVIPNKELITGRLINWTLTDSTNRIVINVGVAYGTDTRAACQLLETICREHRNVTADPAPVITFEGFGDSTLNIVVRCFLTTLDVRLQTIHELHTEINERFRAEGIEISFPQRDLHIRSLPPELLAAARGDRSAA